MSNRDIADIGKVEREWAEVEELVTVFQKQFKTNASEEEMLEGNKAGQELIERFTPLFKKYCTLIKTGNISKHDKEMLSFVSSFVKDDELKRMLKNPNLGSQTKKELFKRFKFVVETYGLLSEEEIMTDLQMLFLIIAKRYQQMGRSFCGYVYNSYKFEVSRHIKKHIKNPINVPYKVVEYADYMGTTKNSLHTSYEDNYEFDLNSPNMNWLSGKDCSEAFKTLSAIERKIIVKYYLEEWNDRQMSEFFGIHINTVNQKRRNAVKKIAEASNHSSEDIKRNRRSGKKAYVPEL